MTVLAVSSCSASASVRVDQGSVDKSGEAAYRATWQRDVGAIRAADLQFGSSCNRGGDQRACHDVSATAAAAITQFLTDLQGITVPARYGTANSKLVAALTLDRDGLTQRNRGFELQSDSDFVGGNNLLKAAVPALQDAYLQYPADARPDPPLP